ncbi:ArnT family glycosyltransferase [Paenibacillus stellifer]|uniref:ArnT family glycosyltransferase n=1 Tax=Paenibacillus stellifer TaxID=169760 RepID=UPI0006918F32|nr:glycosyltransferase family 39 protein [Paenibacillus stellifer]
MLQRLTAKALYLLLALFMGLFIVSSMFIRAKYNYGVYDDTPILESQKPGILILLVILLLISGIALYRLSLRLNKYRMRVVIPVTLLISFAVQIAIVFLFPRVPTDDSETVLQLALDMLYDKDYSSFQSGGYLYMFPFNFSIVLYLKALLAIFPDNYLVIKTFNILFTLATTLMIYLMYRELNGKSEDKAYGVLIAAAAFIPSLFMNNLIYNDVIATAFLTAAIYTCIRFVKRPSIKYAVLSAILLAIGNYFRSIGALVLIAACIYLLLSLKSIGVKKGILAICILGLAFNIPNWTQNAVLQASGIVDEPVDENSAPVYMWLNMGFNLDTWGFWDNRESYRIYQNDANYNKEESTVLFKESIQNKLAEASFSDIVKMYYKKTVWTWTEGTYQLDRYGIGNQGSAGSGGMNRGFLMGSYSYSTAVTESFTSDSAYRSGLLWIVYVMNLLMYVFTLVRLIGGIRHRRFGEIFLVLVILGFIGFYMLWEIKARYIYPVYPLFIVLSCMGFKDFYNAWLTKYIPLFRPVQGSEVAALCDQKSASSS